MYATVYTIIKYCIVYSRLYNVEKEIYFPRYNMKCSGENEILQGIFRVVSRVPQHFVLYVENFDYFFDSIQPPQI